MNKQRMRDFVEGNCRDCANADLGNVGDGGACEWVYCNVFSSVVSCDRDYMCEHYEYEKHDVELDWTGKRKDGYQYRADEDLYGDYE